MGCQTISDYMNDWSQCINGTDYSGYCYDSNSDDIISSLPSVDYATLNLLVFNFDTTDNSLYTTESNIEGKNTISGSYQGYRFPRYNNLNTQSRASNPTSNTFNDNNTDGGMYSYGNYYTWAAAIADTTEYSSGDHGATSICPAGWRLPQGNTSSAGFGKLSISLGGPKYGATANSSSTPTGTVMSGRFRSYPNNFLYSGYFNKSSVYYRGGNGLYLSSVAHNYHYSYDLFLYSSIVDPSADNRPKIFGGSIRCVSAS